MYSYIIGLITEIYADHIVIENHEIGYDLIVSNPYNFHVNDKMKVYTYQQIREDAHILFGFKSKEEKELFLRLITVKGIGPKSAINILGASDVEELKGAIMEGNVTYLKKLPGIGPKAANQMVLDLQGKFEIQKAGSNSKNPALEEAGEVLVALGYHQKEVDKVLKLLENEDSDTSALVKKALSLLMK